jgi:glycosyltransferase involved in cell wall biosynthesis
MSGLTDPLVSILIPCYNAEAYVGEAIESALQQTYGNIEIVVVDDGSCDASLDVLRSFGDRILWEAGPHQGGCLARNRALELSKGAFIQFLDADDRLAPMKIERTLPPLVEDRADLVSCLTFLFQQGKEPWPLADPPSPLEADPFVYLMDHNPGTNGTLHRRRCLEKVGGFRPDLPMAQEWDLHVRLGASGVRVAQVPERLVYVRLHEGPKVSSKTRRPGYNLGLMMTLAREMEAAGQFTTERRQALARWIMRFSVYTFRSGELDLARQGFELATTLAPRTDYPGRAWMRWVASIIGPLETERIRARLLGAIRPGRTG